MDDEAGGEAGHVQVVHPVDELGAEHGVLRAHQQAGDDAVLQHLARQPAGHHSVAADQSPQAVQVLVHRLHMGGLLLGLQGELPHALLNSDDRLGLLVKP